MSFEFDAPDLTRWNRAGLARFRYIDGNAATFFARLRAAQAEAFSARTSGQWTRLLDGEPLDPDSESAAARSERWLANYHGERGDYAYEILRVLARSTHVLGEHIDAFANEGFLPTATQFDSVRRLVALLDYRPSPPASAITPIAILARSATRLAAGFAIQHVPAGAPPVVFETLADLDIEPALNELRPRDWNRSQEPFTYAAAGPEYQGELELEAGATLPAVGAIAILHVAAHGGIPEYARAVRVHGIDGARVTLRGQAVAGGAPLTVPRWRVSLLSHAALVRTPRLSGSDVIAVAANHQLSLGARVAWQQGGTWHVGKVLALDGNQARIEGTHLPAEGAALHLLLPAVAQPLAGASGAIVPGERGAEGTVWDDDGAELSVLQRIDTASKALVYEYVAPSRAWYVPARSAAAATVTRSDPLALRLDGTPGDLATDAWVAIEDTAGLRAARIEVITRGDKEYSLELQVLAAPRTGALLHMAFANTGRPLEHDRNEAPAFLSHAAQGRATVLPISIDAWPSVLSRGRLVIVACAELAARCTITAVDTVHGTLTMEPPLPDSTGDSASTSTRWARADTRIYANVADASHGERKPAKMLGSGDATASAQRFVLDAKDLAWLPDASMPSGVRAAVDVFVGDLRYAQVGSLRSVGPTDAAYEISQRDDGRAELHFGDGRHGRRLPTGRDNLRAIYRQGSGLAGNLASGSLGKPKRNDPNVTGVLQPIAASGGAALESPAQMRASAPKRVLTLERAVSVTDFALLAQQHAAVWQAHAYRNAVERARARGSRAQEFVHVVIVPAGGGAMGPLAAELEAYLEGHAMPGVAVLLEDHQPLPLHLEIVLRVDASAYVPEDVIARVRSALIDGFSLQRMRLGAPLFASALTYAVEQVEGVENAIVTVLPDTFATAAPPLSATAAPSGGLRSLRPRPHQLLFIDPIRSLLQIRSEAFSL